MKKMFVILMMLVIMINGYALAYEEEVVELTFADDFIYKDDDRLHTFAFIYDDGTSEAYITIGDPDVVYTIKVTYDEEHDLTTWRCSHYDERNIDIPWELKGSIEECNTKEFQDRLTQNIGLLLSMLDEEG